MNLPDTLTGTYVGTSQIDLSHLGPSLLEMRPVELYLKADGSINNEPSVTIVMVRPPYGPVFGQVSLKMLNDAMRQVGYQIMPV